MLVSEVIILRADDIIDNAAVHFLSRTKVDIVVLVVLAFATIYQAESIDLDELRLGQSISVNQFHLDERCFLD
jgi:hypothetical protein